MSQLQETRKTRGMLGREVGGVRKGCRVNNAKKQGDDSKGQCPKTASKDEANRKEVCSKKYDHRAPENDQRTTIVEKELNPRRGTIRRSWQGETHIKG